MKTILLAGVVFLVPSTLSVLAQTPLDAVRPPANDKPVASPRVDATVGDETGLIKVKATPWQYVDKPFISMGIICVSDHYNYGYGSLAAQPAQTTHSSLEFIEIVTPVWAGKTTTKDDYGETIFSVSSQR